MSSDTQNSRKCASPRRTNLSSSVGFTICSKLAQGTSEAPGRMLVVPAMVLRAEVLSRPFFDPRPLDHYTISWRRACPLHKPRLILSLWPMPRRPRVPETAPQVGLRIALR